MTMKPGPKAQLKQLDPATKEKLYRELEGTDFLEEMVSETLRRSGEAGLKLTPSGPQITDYGSALFLAQELAAAGMVPKAFEIKDSGGKPNVPALAIAMMAGQRVGLDALASVQSIMVVNGIPSLWGGAPLAICYEKPNIFDQTRFREWWEVDGKEVADIAMADLEKPTTAACATVARVGGEPYTIRFSVADAKKADLWGASGKLYGKYPKRMLKHRALGYALKDRFPDILLGLGIKGVTGADREDDDGDDETAPAPRNSVLDRVAAAAPGEQVAAPVPVVESAPAAPIAPPVALADLVEVVTGKPVEIESTQRRGQADIGGVLVKDALAEQAKQDVPAAEEASGEPDLAVLRPEAYARLRKLGENLGVKANILNAILPAGQDITRAGCYEHDLLVASVKDEIMEHKAGARSAAV